MKVLNLYPPNYEAVKLIFPNSEEHKPIFCYEDTIYNPFNIEVTPDLEVHEGIHQKQQGNDVEGWWNRYLTNKEFRLEMEIEAYGAQYKFIKERIPKKFADYGLEKMSFALSGELYGSLLSYGKARSKIRNYAKNI
jgi:hypothetical protein